MSLFSRNRKFSHRSSFAYAIVLHIILFAFLFWHFVSPSINQTPLQPEVDIIQAVAVSQADLTKIAEAKAQQQRAIEEAARKKQEQIKKAQEEALRVKEQQRQQAEQQKQQEIAKQKALKEQQQKAEQVKAEQAALAEKAALQKQQKAEKLKQEKAALAEQALSEKKQQDKEELEKAAAEEKAADDKKAEEAKKEAAQKLKIAKQKELDAQIALEKKAAETARTANMQSEIEKYKALIENAIQQHWLVPEGTNQNLSCELLIRVAAGGVVQSVSISRSSGDSALDNSARSAVFKASPLPMPEDHELFDQFREINLTVKPEHLQSL